MSSLFPHNFFLLVFYTYHSPHHPKIIQPIVKFATKTGPARPFPQLVLRKTNHSLIKCHQATPYVAIASWYIWGLVIWYAAYIRTIEAKRVQVPKVREERGVATDWEVEEVWGEDELEVLDLVDLGGEEDPGRRSWREG